jgi:ParB-like chromosome segregation protein Spo0J
MNERVKELLAALKEEISSVDDVDNKIDLVNEVRLEIHEVSPLKDHPADCVLWERSDAVEVQRINPNAVAPPEMELLYESIKNDGYSMSCVAWKQPDGTIRIVDGFHRRQIERTHPDIAASTFHRIPLSLIRKSQEGEGDRMASTIRHNRARGTHNIELMSTIVAELVEMGKGDRWIQKHIGMSADELLRLKQITGVAALFANRDFSDSWEADVTPVEEMKFDNEA